MRAFIADFRATYGHDGPCCVQRVAPVAPATTSARIVEGMIRDSSGFQGLLMSDDVAMGALSGRIAARTGAAIAAGRELAASPAAFIRLTADVCQGPRGLA